MRAIPLERRKVCATSDSRAARGPRRARSAPPSWSRRVGNRPIASPCSALPTSRALPNARQVDDFRARVTAALEYSGVFRRVDEAAFLGPVTSSAGPRRRQSLDCPTWTQIGADAVAGGPRSRVATTRFSVSFRVWDASRCRRLVRRRYQQKGSGLDPTARRLADDIVEAFIGLRGVSSTEIAFVSDRGGNKEIYVMGADGSSARAATANRSLNNFPSWSPGRHRDPLHVVPLPEPAVPLPVEPRSGAPGAALSRLGDERPQYRGVFAPDRERMALVMSDNGDAPTSTAVGRRARPAPSHPQPRDRGLARLVSRRQSHGLRLRSDGLSPDLRHECRREQCGPAHLSTAPTTRIPSWSPDGLWIAYETRVDGQFDIWLIDPEGGDQHAARHAPAQRRGTELVAQLAASSCSARRVGGWPISTSSIAMDRI